MRCSKFNRLNSTTRCNVTRGQCAAETQGRHLAVRSGGFFRILFSRLAHASRFCRRCSVCVSFIRTTMKVQLDTEIAIQI